VVRDWKTRRLTRGYAFALAGLLGMLAFVVSSGAITTAAACTAPSAGNPAVPQHLTDSNFEIDAILPPSGNKNNSPPTGGANLTPNSTGCIDWTSASVGESRQTDGLTGSGDSAFGQGTSENDAVPTIVTDSIPPNKSDLKSFDVYEEHAGTKTYVAVDWSRINSPQGTTNMDFEFNKNACAGTVANPTPNVGGCSANGVTPARSSGDKLLIYNLSSGGTSVSILLRTWNGSTWANETALNSSQALGSINYETIAAGNSDSLGALDPLTFGEAVVDFQALLGGTTTCGSFGSVYLKSRSSDSFSAEMKDFVPPKAITLTNCTAISTSATASVVVGNSISDTATLTNANSPTGFAVFKVYSDSGCTALVTTINGSNWTGSNGTYTSTATYQNPAVGTYYWIASYAGDQNNSAATGACGDAGETSEVTKASPSITTSANESVTVGTDIHDTATLSGAVQTNGSVGGTVQFKVYGPFTGADPSQDACTSNTLASTIDGSALSGPDGSGNFTSTATYTPSAVGRYRWTASYSGDAKNNAVAETACIAPGELDTVVKASPSITTSANETVTVGADIHDTATLSGAVQTNGSVGGTIEFKVYGPFTDATPGDDACTAGTLLSTIAGSALSGPDASGNFTSTATYSPTAVGRYRWTASYTGDAKNNAVAETACIAPGELDTVNPAASTIGTNQKVYPNDSASVTGTTGNVTFELYGPFATAGDVVCTGGVAFSQTVTQAVGQTSNYPGGVTTPFVVNANNDGWYGWKVVAAADATHTSATSNCTEKVNIAITD
jgi:hypothetical protein